jgi:hypothetical protein
MKKYKINGKKCTRMYMKGNGTHFTFWQRLVHLFVNPMFYAGVKIYVNDETSQIVENEPVLLVGTKKMVNECYDKFVKELTNE